MISNEEKKAKLIVSEILSYFFMYDTKSIRIDSEFKDDKLIIIAEGIPTKRPQHLEDMKRLINVRRSPQIEDYYATLLGWESDYNDINLLGSMVDSGIISYDGKILSFYVERNLI